MKYYISDLHLFHNRILEKFNRPFSSVEEMHEVIINNWKNKVKDDDTVYILGDVGMYHAREIGNILNNLPGRKILVTGNHDFKNIHSSSYKKTFAKITSYLEIEDWNGKYRGYYHLHGHVHNNGDSLSKKDRRYNVSAEIVDYTPISLDELEQK